MLVLSVVSSCAVPVAPTGGPADSTAPAILEVTPADGATNVTDDRIRISFSEYVNEATFAQAFSLTPEPELPPEFAWSGRTVSVSLRSPLRTNTTYRVTIDRGLRDVRNVALMEPIVVAFSTGPRINEASLHGTIVDALTGSPESGMDVFAYPASDTMTTVPFRPLYRTQTDNNGRFALTYLSAGRYYVIGVADGNGNRRPDEGERVAIPDEPAAHASEETPDSLRMIASRFDATPPSVRRTSATSTRTIEVRYSEPVLLANGRQAGWSAADSASGRNIGIDAAYVRHDDPASVVLRLGEETPTGNLIVTSGAVTDSVGNPAPGTTTIVRASNVNDTTTVRLISIRPAGPDADSTVSIGVHEPIVVGLSAALPPGRWLHIRRAESHELLEWASSTLDGRTYQIQPGADAGEVFTLEVQLPDSADPGARIVRQYRILRSGEVGDVGGTVASDPASTIVEVYPSSAASHRIRAPIAADRTFRISGLRAGTYGVRAFVDEDENQRWTPGAFLPYKPGEPITWVADSVEVRPRFETVIPDTLSFE